MKKEVSFVMSENLTPALPKLEMEVRYFATASIELDSEGREVEFNFSDLSVSVNGEHWYGQDLPLETDGQDARHFLARMREAARRELYRQENHKPSLQEMFRPGKPERDFIE